MEKKESTPRREARRRYEEKNKEKRKAANGTFSTYLPRKELEEINEFLKKYGVTKVELVRQGYLAVKQQIEGSYKEK